MVVSTGHAVVAQELIINPTTIEWQRPGCWKIVKLNVQLQKFVMGSNSAWGAVKSGNVYPKTLSVWKVLLVSAIVLKIKAPCCFETIVNCLPVHAIWHTGYSHCFKSVFWCCAANYSSICCATLTFFYLTFCALGRSCLKHPVGRTTCVRFHLWV